MLNKIQNIPTHVAIIPDGNRRWAKRKGLESWEGHEEGAKNVEKVLKANLDLGIKYVTFWGSSLDNLKKRPIAEKKALLDIYRKYFLKLTDSSDIHNNQVQVNVIGRWEEQFPETLKKIIRRCISRTKRYQKYFLNFLLAYSGDDEIISAINNLMMKCKGKAKITAKMLKGNLLTSELPRLICWSAQAESLI